MRESALFADLCELVVTRVRLACGAGARFATNVETSSESSFALPDDTALSTSLGDRPVEFTLETSA